MVRLFGVRWLGCSVFSGLVAWWLGVRWLGCLVFGGSMARRFGCSDLGKEPKKRGPKPPSG